MVRMSRCCIILIAMFIFSQIAIAQSVDLESVDEDIKQQVEKVKSGDAFSLTGGLSANNIFYHSNQSFAGRQAYTYYLQGRLNFGFLSWSMPISYSLTNQGKNLGYELPFKFNRLSLNPRYKWIQGHIGDVAMNFSPYTLNGHLFTGGGLDLAPPKLPLKVSVMGGRLLKAVNDDVNPNTLPAFRRMGYGTRLIWDADKFSIGAIGFYAKDDLHSLDSVPESKQVLPQENLVLSVMGKVKISRQVELFAEYASSALTNDLRAGAASENPDGLAAYFFNNRTSTQVNQAYKGGVNLFFNKMTVGLQYEWIDPEYRTLGAYYFNNDFENLTLNLTRQFFKGKVNVAFNGGYQRDNLKGQKGAETGRWVAALNVNAQCTDKLSLQVNVSDFTTYTNMKLNQFELINDASTVDNTLDTLDFKQIVRTASFNLNYALRADKQQTQNLNFSYNLNDVANKQGDVVRTGDASSVHNAALAHAIFWLYREVNLNTSVNYTYNTIGFEEAQMYGGSVNVGKQWLHGRLSVSGGVAYNHDQSISGSSDIINLRLIGAYTFWKKHSLNINAVQMYRNTSNESLKDIQDLTVTFGYNYSF